MLSLHQNINDLSARLDNERARKDDASSYNVAICTATLSYIAAHYAEPLHTMSEQMQYYYNAGLLSDSQFAALPNAEFNLFIEDVNASGMAVDQKIAMVKVRASDSIKHINSLKDSLEGHVGHDALSVTLSLTEYAHIYIHINALIDELTHHHDIDNAWAYRALDDHTPLTDSAIALRTVIKLITTDHRIDPGDTARHITHTIITAIIAWYTERLKHVEFEDKYYCERDERGSTPLDNLSDVRHTLNDIVAKSPLSFTDLDDFAHMLECRIDDIQTAIDAPQHADSPASTPYRIFLKNTVTLYEEIIYLLNIKDDFLEHRR